MKRLKITKTITERTTADSQSANDESGIMPHLRLGDLEKALKDPEFCVDILRTYAW